jgi:hypothetical protein
LRPAVRAFGNHGVPADFREMGDGHANETLGFPGRKSPFSKAASHPSTVDCQRPAPRSCSGLLCSMTDDRVAVDEKRRRMSMRARLAILAYTLAEPVNRVFRPLLR